MNLVYKICSRAEWDAAEGLGRFTGSTADLADGFIHLSAGNQMRETAARHFKGMEGLVLVAFRGDDLDGLRWEPSRGGALFPHVYGSLPTTKALWVRPLNLVDGVHRFPDET